MDAESVAGSEYSTRPSLWDDEARLVLDIRRIQHMEEQLCIMRNKREQQILELRWSRPSTIRLLSDEILAMVFEKNPQTQRERNHALILVCLRWHNIVMKTPHLWRNVIIRPKALNEMPLHFLYASTCRRLSSVWGEVTYLDIHLDYRQLRIRTPLGKGVSYKEDYTLPQSLDASGLDYALLTMVSILRGFGNPDHLYWRTFCLHLWGDYPRAESVQSTLSRLGSKLDGFRGIIRVFQIFGCPVISFKQPTSLRGLEEFQTNMQGDFGESNLLGNPLERLVLANPTSCNSFLLNTSPSFPFLSVLHLYVAPLEFLVNPPWPSIHFPVLKFLTIMNEWNENLLERFDAPNLTYVQLDACVSCAPPTPLTKGSSLRILRNVTDLMWNAELSIRESARRSSGKPYVPPPQPPELSLRSRDVLEQVLCSTPALKRIHLRAAGQSESLAVQELIKDGVTSAKITKDPAEWPYPLTPGGSQWHPVGAWCPGCADSHAESTIDCKWEKLTAIKHAESDGEW